MISWEIMISLRGNMDFLKNEGISIGGKYIAEGFMNHLLFPMED